MEEEKVFFAIHLIPPRSIKGRVGESSLITRAIKQIALDMLAKKLDFDFVHVKVPHLLREPRGETKSDMLSDLFQGDLSRWHNHFDDFFSFRGQTKVALEPKIGQRSHVVHQSSIGSTTFARSDGVQIQAVECGSDGGRGNNGGDRMTSNSLHSPLVKVLRRDLEAVGFDIS